MRKMVLVAVLLLSSLAPARAQKESADTAVPKKGDTITVKGCLAGGALQATEVTSATETPMALAGGLTFRLTGDKKLLKALRDDHNGTLVAVKGVLKSELPRDGSDSRQVGRMRVTIGSVPSPLSPEAEARRSLPVLETKSFDGGTTSCGR